MTAFRVLFHLPREIEQGLATGAYRRVGGIIRDNADGQKIVMHLKEAHVSRVLNPVRVPNLLSSVGAVASVANLAVSIAGFALVLQKLGAIEDQLRGLEKRVSRLDAKMDKALALTTCIERLAWSRLYSRVEAAIELGQRATIVSSQLGMAHASAALAALMESQKEFGRLAIDSELPLPVRSGCAQMSFVSAAVQAALYARLGEDAAAEHVLAGQVGVAGVLRDATQVEARQVPLVMRFHPKLVTPTTRREISELHGWEDPDLDRELASSLQRDLGVRVPAADASTFVARRKEFEDALTAGAAKGRLHYPSQAALVITTHHVLTRTNALTQCGESYNLQAAEGKRLGLGAAMWDRAVPADCHAPQDAELVFLLPLCGRLLEGGRRRSPRSETRRPG